MVTFAVFSNCLLFNVSHFSAICSDLFLCASVFWCCTLLTNCCISELLYSVFYWFLLPVICRIRSADELTEWSDKKSFKCIHYPVSVPLSITCYLHFQRTFDVSKRPHFQLRPTSCEIKYTGSQKFKSTFILWNVFTIVLLKSLLNMSCVSMF